MFFRLDMLLFGVKFQVFRRIIQHGDWPGTSFYLCPKLVIQLGGHWGTRFWLQSRGMEIDGIGKNCFRFCIFEKISVHRCFSRYIPGNGCFKIKWWAQSPSLFNGPSVDSRWDWEINERGDVKGRLNICEFLGEVPPINNLIHSFSYFNLVNKYKFSQNLWWIFITRFADVCCFGVNIGVPWFWHVLTIRPGSVWTIVCSSQKDWVQEKGGAVRAAVHGCGQGYQPLSCA